MLERLEDLNHLPRPRSVALRFRTAASSRLRGLQTCRWINAFPLAEATALACENDTLIVIAGPTRLTPWEPSPQNALIRAHCLSSETVNYLWNLVKVDLSDTSLSTPHCKCNNSLYIFFLTIRVSVIWYRGRRTEL